MKPEFILGLGCVVSLAAWIVVGDIYHRSIIRVLSSTRNQVFRWCISIFTFSVLLGIAFGFSFLTLGLIFGWDFGAKIPSEYFAPANGNIFISFEFWLLAGPGLCGVIGLAISRFRYADRLKKLGAYE